MTFDLELYIFSNVVPYVIIPYYGTKIGSKMTILILWLTPTLNHSFHGIYKKVNTFITVFLLLNFKRRKYSEQLGKATYPIDIVKLFILGDSAAGKTTLQQSLIVRSYWHISQVMYFARVVSFAKMCVKYDIIEHHCVSTFRSLMCFVSLLVDIT